MNPSILIIEDDPDIARAVQYILEKQGYHVRVARNGKSGLQQATKQRPDLIVLDLGLPDLTGEEVMQQLRQRIHVPVIVLSADDEPRRKARLLDAGAAGYLTKPCLYEELLARINVQLRRSLRQPRIQVGDLMLCPVEHRVWFGEQEVRLTRREEEILTLLAKHPGRVFSRDELRERLWGEQQCENTTIDTHVNYVRAKLRKAGAHDVIRTVRGVGFGIHRNEDTSSEQALS